MLVLVCTFLTLNIPPPDANGFTVIFTKRILKRVFLSKTAELTSSHITRLGLPHRYGIIQNQGSTAHVSLVSSGKLYIFSILIEKRKSMNIG